jgi:hypothetical protein
VKRDLRDYSKKTDRQLVIGGILLLFLVGGGLIWWFYGTGAAGLGITCLMAGVSVVLIILFLFWAIDRIIERARPK